MTLSTAETSPLIQPPATETAEGGDAFDEAAPESAVRVQPARAFREIYDAHVDFVWRNLRRIGVREAELDDKTQEVFVIAYRRFASYEDRGHGPRAWLFQIAVRVASEARRHKRRHPEDLDGGVAEANRAIEPGQANAVLQREQMARLDRALQTIDPAQRSVLVLADIEEMSAPEIAESLGIPMNTVYSRLRLARTKLEAALAQDPENDGRGGGER